MKKLPQLAAFFDLWRGRLGAADKAELEARLEESSDLRSEYEKQQRVFAALDSLAAKQHGAPLGFSSQVLAQVRQSKVSLFRRLFMGRTVRIAAGCCSLALIALALSLTPLSNPGKVWELQSSARVAYNDARVANSTQAILTYIGGTFGFVLIMLSGLLTLAMLALRRQKSAFFFGTCTLGLFLFRHLLDTYFDLVDFGHPHALNALLTYLEGSVVPLLMLAAAAATFICIFVRSWKLSATCAVMTLALFTTRSMTATFFNDRNISDGHPGLTTRYNDMRIAPLLGKVAQERHPAVPQPGMYAAQGVLVQSDDYSESSYAFQSREGYGEYSENPRFEPSQNPVSTFSIDVDTASYSNARRFIMQGQVPPPQSVRVEEFINYFDYDYPGATDRPFSVHYEIAPSPFDSARHLLKIGLKARTVPMDNERGWNLVFLVDVSGSMSDSNKLPLVKESLKLLVQRMRPVDRIAIVTYAGAAGLLLPSTSGEQKSRINSAIDSLSAGGSTNGSGGINLAYDVAASNRIENSVNRVILATDGDFNVGVSSFDGLMQLIEEKRRSGITLTTLGFGQGNIQEQNMEQLANRGNGNYFYIDSFREARKVLDSGLAANMEVVAKDVKLQIEFNPALVREYRLIGFDNRRLKREDFTNDAKDAGEIGSGHTVTALYEVLLTTTDTTGTNAAGLRYQSAPAKPATASLDELRNGEIGFLKIRHKEPEGSVSTESTVPLLGSTVKTEFDASSVDFRFAAAVAQFGQVLRQSQFVSGSTIGEILRIARGAQGEDSQGLRSEFVKLVEDTKALRRE